MGQTSGIGVLDKAVLLLRQVALGPATLPELIRATRLPKATAHRIAAALEIHGLLGRDQSGAWVPGPALTELRAREPDLANRAGPILEQLCRETGESAQLFQRDAEVRVCTAVADRASGLRDTVPLGARLPMTAGSAAHVLMAWSCDEAADRAVLRRASFSARTLAEVRRLGYAHSSAEREAGVASISAPVRDRHGTVTAAVSVSGPVGRLGRRPESALVTAVLGAAGSLTG